MTAKIIGAIQVKGSAGRSTLATNLAGELAKIGQAVLIDGDISRMAPAHPGGYQRSCFGQGNL